MSRAGNRHRGRSHGSRLDGGVRGAVVAGSEQTRAYQHSRQRRRRQRVSKSRAEHSFAIGAPQESRKRKNRQGREEQHPRCRRGRRLRIRGSRRRGQHGLARRNEIVGGLKRHRESCRRSGQDRLRSGRKRARGIGRHLPVHHRLAGCRRRAYEGHVSGKDADGHNLQVERHRPALRHRQLRGLPASQPEVKINARPAHLGAGRVAGGVGCGQRAVNLSGLLRRELQVDGAARSGIQRGSAGGSLNREIRGCQRRIHRDRQARHGAGRIVRHDKVARP